MPVVADVLAPNSHQPQKPNVPPQMVLLSQLPENPTCQLEVPYAWAAGRTNERIDRIMIAGPRAASFVDMWYRKLSSSPEPVGSIININ